ncbi:TIGR03067 domain-containing protein [Luteibacter flocculans]|uniref:TIGR03067 domain-containing protein n=1 Tax=Luteibacter flocculans TaxID=2780091 RepID=A0ABY4T5G2_9GAMM|nr:TIGR03067 domain-containing protein [Luteibacter flocculans]URL58006.1 TIGR03067 domain-containing protein [Luteibacter flocculans]
MDDLQMLQGAWKQVRFEENGVIEPTDIHGGNGRITTIDGDRFAVRSPMGELLLAGRFILDPTAHPKSITWIDSMGDDAGKLLPATYRLSNDEFVFIASDEGMPRSLVFATSPGLTLRGFVRHRV